MTTLLTLDENLLRTIGDYRSMAVTTAIAASTSVVSTHFEPYRSTADYFNGYWIYVTDKANAGDSRYVSDDDGTDTLTVLGANFTSDGANLATVLLSKFQWQNRVDAINQAISEVYPSLYKEIDDTSLISGNILPDGSFEDWATSATLTWYTASNTTLEKTTTNGLYRGQYGSTSAKSTASAASGYFYVASNSSPVFDVNNQTITFRAWAYPQTANDAKLVIYVTKTDGTTVTTTSTTTSTAAQWTLIEIEDYTIPSNTYSIQFRFVTTTNGQYVYWDSARVTGIQNSSYVLPYPLIDGSVSQVYIQTSSSNSENPCDDVAPVNWRPIVSWDVNSDNGIQYIELPSSIPSNYAVRLIGKAPYAEMDSASDTINLTNPTSIRLLSTYAAYRLYSNASSTASGSDRDKCEQEANRYLNNYYRLAHLKQSQKPVQLNVRY
jgi:hypothetical protein